MQFKRHFPLLYNNLVSSSFTLSSKKRNNYLLVSTYRYSKYMCATEQLKKRKVNINNENKEMAYVINPGEEA